MAPHLTPEDKQHILRRHQQGASLRGIAREIGRPDITVRRTLESLGVDFGPPKTSNKRSSPEAEARVVRLYDEGSTWGEIMEQAGVTSTTVAKILRRNGRDLTRKPEGTQGKEEIMAALYEAGHSTRAIGQMLGHSKSTINAVVTGNGGEMRQRPGCERPDYFEQVDTPEKAYWLGFIAADGCVITTSSYPEGSHLAVQLAIRDRTHLLKLKEATGALGAVHDEMRAGSRGGRWRSGGSSTLYVYSRRLTKSLLVLGITPRKSATVEPWDGPADLMPHYWRGLIDGDGSLARKGPGLWTVFLCGSEACVRGFAAWAAEICGTKAVPYFNTGCWYVSISGRFQVPKLVRALYGDATVSLDRKQERADLILKAALPDN